MRSDQFKVINGSAAGAWIRPRLGGKFGAVTREAPEGFEAYARLFHSASDPNGKRVRWADVAKACGTTPHGEMQWHAILGLADADELRGSYSPFEPAAAKWIGSDPPTGAMDTETLDALSEILASHAADTAHCFFGLSTITGWIDSFSTEELQPLLELPDGRDYIILSGPLSAVDQIAYHWSERASLRLILVARTGEEPPPEPDASDLIQREAPNLIWPPDRSWFVATEVDFDSTLVGGSVKLIRAIVESPQLEAWQVEPTTSLAADADKVNDEGGLTV
jgi:hypothetical protein